MMPPAKDEKRHDFHYCHAMECYQRDVHQMPNRWEFPVNTLDEMASAARDVGACFDWDNNEDYVPGFVDIWRSDVACSRNDDASIEDCTAYLA
jgi:hypothetical protein